MIPRIYLDHHATTPVDPRVLDVMLPYFNSHFGNAASRTHVFGWEAEEAVDIARGRIADLIHAQKKEIIFTSGATESNNLALMGIAGAYTAKGRHIITVATEHKSVLDTCEFLGQNGFEITYLPVDKEGFVDLDELKKSITAKTILISIMTANNEIGTIQNISEIGKIAREKNVLFHSDIAQAFGKIPLNMEVANLDLASISGHKIYAPKGIGALFVRRRKPRVTLMPILHGGGHEEGFRSGTLNVPGIVGLGQASKIAFDELELNFRKDWELRRLLYLELSKLDGVHVNGPEIHQESNRSKNWRLPNNLNISFEHVDGEGLIHALKYIAVSTGSACNSAIPTPSHVLKAIGVSPKLSKASIRFGLGRFNTKEEIQIASDLICKTVRKLRE